MRASRSPHLRPSSASEQAQRGNFYPSAGLSSDSARHLNATQRPARLRNARLVPDGANCALSSLPSPLFKVALPSSNHSGTIRASASSTILSSTQSGAGQRARQWARGACFSYASGRLPDPASDSQWRSIGKSPMSLLLAARAQSLTTGEPMMRDVARLQLPRGGVAVPISRRPTVFVNLRMDCRPVRRALKVCQFQAACSWGGSNRHLCVGPPPGVKFPVGLPDPAAGI